MYAAFIACEYIVNGIALKVTWNIYLKIYIYIMKVYFLWNVCWIISYNIYILTSPSI